MCGSTATTLKGCYGSPFHQELVGTKKNENGENVRQYVGCTGDPPAGGRRHRSRRRNRTNNRNRKGRGRKSRRH